MTEDDCGADDLTWTAVSGKPISTVIMGYTPEVAKRSWRPKVYLDFRDWWVGLYISEAFVYVCPLPTLVFRWARPGWETIYELGNYQSVGEIPDEVTFEITPDPHATDADET